MFAFPSVLEVVDASSAADCPSVVGWVFWTEVFYGESGMLYGHSHHLQSLELAEDNNSAIVAHKICPNP